MYKGRLKEIFTQNDSNYHSALVSEKHEPSLKLFVCQNKNIASRRVALPNKSPHRPDAIWQRDANFQFSKANKTKHAIHIASYTCIPTSLNC